jgi:CRISPR system Cascade subunit CasE
MNHLSQAIVPFALAADAKLTDGYVWHQAIWQAFPGRADDARDFLFRVDRRKEGFRVLLLSAHAPEATDVLAWQTKAVGPSFLTHDFYRFQLKANPTFRRKEDRRRLAIYDEARLMAWMERKAKASGFVIKPGTLTVSAPIDETCKKDGHIVKHVAVDFTGVLRVTDRSRFTTSFNTGIGSAKGFGFGLLMLQPLH